MLERKISYEGGWFNKVVVYTCQGRGTLLLDKPDALVHERTVTALVPSSCRKTDPPPRLVDETQSDRCVEIPGKSLRRAPSTLGFAPSVPRWI